MMNSFRFIGDMSHFASFILLLVQLHYTKSASGEQFQRTGVQFVGACTYTSLLGLGRTAERVARGISLAGNGLRTRTMKALSLI
jgi:hypothetical protein